MNCFLFIGAMIPLILFAKPKNLTIRSGSASVQHFDRHTHIKTSPQAILHWQDFSIAREESVHFAQEGARSAVLNRVTGKNCSHLLGSLTSNGAVFLINPNGVYIGGSAHIQTGGFLASTADLSNDDFLKGKDLLFKDPGEGTITHKGCIRCPTGDIYLIAKTIQNDGILSAENSALVSGQDILIRPKSKQVLIRPGMQKSAKEVKIDLQKESPYTLAIQHTGHIEATTVCEENGHIYLVAETGKVEVDGSLVGPKTFVLGDEVHLKENAFVDGSGPVGGIVLIGGDYQGKNPEILNAKTTRVEKGGMIRSEGYEGKGGKIIVWSDGNSHFYGHLSAQALGEKGDGGFAEISGSKGLWLDDHPDLCSKTGRHGLLLLDPGSVSIVNGPNVGPPVSMDSFNDAWIADQLQTVSSLSISTANSTNGGTETLTVDGAVSISWSSANDLTLIGRRNAVINSGASITATGSGSIEIQGNTSGTATGSFTGIQINGNISTISGNITFDGTSGNSGSDTEGIEIRNGSLNTDTGIISLTGVSRAPGNGVDGILIINSSITSTGTSPNPGSITADGTAQIGTEFTDGLNLINSTVTTNDASITFVGNAISASGGRIQGIDLSSSTVQSSGEGAITFTGTGSPNADNSTSPNAGIFLGQSNVDTNTGAITFVGEGNGQSAAGIFLTGSNSRVRTVSGEINLTGTTNGANDENHGIVVFNSSKIESITGSNAVILNGTGSSAGTNDNHGVVISDNASTFVSSNNGNIQITGQGGGDGTGTNNRGILIQSAGSVQATGTATVTLDGTGGSGTDMTEGVVIDGTNSEVNSSSSAISLTGIGAGTATNADGIAILSSGTVTAGGSGAVTMNGTASPTGTTGNDGIFISGSGSAVSTSTGNLTLVGTGDGSGSSNRGVQVAAAGAASSTSGTIDVTGTGSTAGTSLGGGVLVTGINSQIDGTTSPVMVTGAGNGSGTDCDGVTIESGGAVSSTTGGLTLQGTGGANTPSYGVRVTGANSSISSTTGEINVTGTANAATEDGMLITSGGTINSTAGATINVQTLSDLTITTASSISSAGPVTVTADRDLIITAGANPLEDAIIESTGSTTTTFSGRSTLMTSNANSAAQILAQGALAVVVDNDFPTAPGIGPGLLSKDALSIISSSAGPVRVFTARQPLNTILGDINGVAFVPGTEFVDTAQEQWETYFFNSFNGTPFTVFYKDGVPIPPTPPIPPSGNGDDDNALRMIFRNIAANLTQLADLLPFYFSNYHFSTCTQDQPEKEEELDKEKDCNPNFSPYGSFIFEDGVYWIQEAAQEKTPRKSLYIFEENVYWQQTP